MEGYQNPYHHHQQQMQQQQQQQQMMTGGVGTPVSLDAGDRFPQWSVQETKEFLMIRAEFDRSFMETKRNKILWEAIASKMKEKGFARSSDQCKCKWKNLVTRYKGCETMEPEAMRQQFPFYNELHAIFSARMQRMLWAEAEGSAAVTAATPTTSTAVAAGKRRVAASSDEEDDDEVESEGEQIRNTRKRKKKAKTGGNTGGTTTSLREVVEELMRRQITMEEQWREAWEAREEERRRKEDEWRKTMEVLERERLMMEKSWREREEQRRIRDEARAEKRDALITALLNRLTRGDSSS